MRPRTVTGRWLYDVLFEPKVNDQKVYKEIVSLIEAESVGAERQRLRDAVAALDHCSCTGCESDHLDRASVMAIIG